MKKNKVRSQKKGMKLNAVDFSPVLLLTKYLLLIGLIIMFSISNSMGQENQNFNGNDTLNEYDILILDLEYKGVDLEDFFNDEGLRKGLSNFDLNLDSLEYYYKKKYFPDVDISAIDAGNFAMIGKSYEDSIVLRWAPTSVELWNKMFTSGYKLQRWNMVLDKEAGTFLLDSTQSGFQELVDTQNLIKMWPLERIAEKITEKDTMALIAAQALYGSSFSSQINTDSLDIVSRAGERDMRFGFSLLMADRSTLAADIMGLRYVDTDVEPGKMYYYMLSPTADSTENLDVSLTIFNDISRNKQIVELMAQGGDGVVKLYWPKFNNNFSGYWIERSSDNGTTWQKLTEQPIVFIDPKKGVQGRMAPIDPKDMSEKELNVDYYNIYTDSVENYANYDYRVMGQTPFADYTDYVYIKGTGVDKTPPPIPQVTSHIVDEETNIAYLEWKMDYNEKQLEDLVSFSIWDASHPDSTYIQISGQLPGTSRSFSSPGPLEKNRSHYYLIKAEDNKGNVVSSFPLYMHMNDDEPPVPPIDLAYLINDTTGLVTLVWKANSERDLMGYRVYFSNSLNSEFTQITKAPIYKNIYFDTLALITLTEKIYYKIQAVDLSYNRSEFSEILEVNRPDNVPPIAPVMEFPEVNSDYVKLKWRPSNSRDVVKQILYRRLYQKSEDWQVLYTTEDPVMSTYADSTGRIEKSYEYTIQVIDDAGLTSEFAFPVKGRRWFDNIIPAVSDFDVKYEKEGQSITLSWAYEPVNHELLDGIDYVFYIYRSVGEAALTRYRLVDSAKTYFVDQKTNEDGDYQYAIKVVYLNGKSGTMSEQKKITVKNE